MTVSIQKFQAWERALETANERGYAATYASLLEDGPQEDVDYDCLFSDEPAARACSCACSCKTMSVSQPDVRPAIRGFKHPPGSADAIGENSER